MDYSTTPTNQQTDHALKRVLDALSPEMVASGSARLLFYSTAAAAIYAVAGGDTTILLTVPAVARLVEKVGGDVLTTIIDRVAQDRHNRLTPADIIRLVEEAFEGILPKDYLREQDFFHVVQVLEGRGQARHMELAAQHDDQSGQLAALHTMLQASREAIESIRYDLTNLFAGLHVSPAEFRNRNARFIEEYLGTKGNPVPFGGRDKELNHLDKWLTDPDAPSYFLMIARAGRWKTALLCRWIARLQERQTARIAFAPVSARFQTNLQGVVFSTIAVRLAHLYGEDVSHFNLSAGQWSSLVADYLRRPPPDGPPLILVLDGLDETAGWQFSPDLFPLTLPSGVKVVASARYLAGQTDFTSWLRRLGWDHPGQASHLSLEPLDLDGVGDVIRKSGLPADTSATNVDISSELHRLSLGDPLLLRLYVEDLLARGVSAARLTTGELLDLRPGRDGYFERWWDDQRAIWGRSAPLKEELVRVLLSVLACALGPLRMTDIVDMMRPEQIESWTLEEAMVPLQRIVFGDGRKHGYVFNHPSLREYFYDRLTPDEQRRWGGTFLSWGTRTMDELVAQRLDPESVPPYLTQYFGEHLELGNSSDEAFIPLLEGNWSRAWHSLEGSYEGFLTDVDRVWHRAMSTNSAAIQVGKLAPCLEAKISCALCVSSIATLSGNVPPELIAALVASGVWTAAQGNSVCMYETDRDNDGPFNGPD